MESFSFLPREHKKAARISNLVSLEPESVSNVGRGDFSVDGGRIRRHKINFGVVTLVAIFLFLLPSFLPTGRTGEQKIRDRFEAALYVQSVFRAEAEPRPSSLPEISENQKLIDIDLSEQKMTIYENGRPFKEYVISTGKRSTPTRTGNFAILSKYPKAYGVIQGVLWTMPYFMGIYKVGGTENGIHELPLANGWRESIRDMGYAVSHGCVRLNIGEAEEVYNWAPIGTPVRIHY